MAETHKRTDLNIDEWRKRLQDERAKLVKVEREERADIIAENRDGSENELQSVASFDPADNADNAAILNDIEREEEMDINQKDLIRQIDHALDRLAQGLYGICEITGKPIPIARLRAIPWATMTVEGAEQAIA